MTARISLLILFLCLTGCSSLTPVPAAQVYKDPALVAPGTYRLKFLLNGQETLAAYLVAEQARNPELKAFEVSSLLRLFRTAYAPLYLPVQPGVPLCNLETNFRHCKGIELQADFDVYNDATVVLHSRVLYHVRLRLEGGQPNFFRTAKAQRDRGEFALPRRYYVGALVEAIGKALPILQEIATDYGKYIKNDGQEVEIELTLEEAGREAEANRVDRRLEDGAHFSGNLVLSALPNLSPIIGVTVSALSSGGRTFWEVLKEEKEFDLCREKLDLPQVEFSYWESSKKNFSHLLLSPESPSDIVLRGIVIRLRQKETPAAPS
ncbi:MAG: hypothetical protein M0009_02405 [Deltaproteobacteria bacterium]|nr:hypothetical protein [Deltaproteobacteria bacterium]